MALHNLSSMVANNENYTHVAHSHQLQKNFYISFFLLLVATVLFVFCKIPNIPYIDLILDDNTTQTLLIVAILAASFGVVILLLTFFILIFKFLFHSTKRIYATPVYEASRFAKPYAVAATEVAPAAVVSALPISSAPAISASTGTVYSIPFDPSKTVTQEAAKSAKHRTKKLAA
jgi:hypothetical protein